MNKNHIIIITWDYWSGKTTVMSGFADRFSSNSLIFDFTERFEDQLRFVSWSISTILMWCNWCADSNSYISYIIQQCNNNIENLFVEIPNDRINLWQVIIWLEKEWYNIHVLWISLFLQNIKWEIVQNFADINMWYAKNIPCWITNIEDLYIWYNIPKKSDPVMQNSNNHNAWGFLKPYISVEDIVWLKEFIQSNTENIERCKWQFYYQGDIDLQEWWYDIEWSKNFNWKIKKTQSKNIFSHNIAIVSSDLESRITFNDRMLWKYNDTIWNRSVVIPTTINKPKMLCYEILLWEKEKFNELINRVKQEQIIDEDYDYWLLFANSMKIRTPLINDEERRLYYNSYYKKKLEILKNFLLINQDNYNHYLLSLANIIYLLRIDTVQDITLDESLRYEIYNSFSLKQRDNIIQSMLPFCNASWIREFTKERVEWYISIINTFK